MVREVPKSRTVRIVELQVSGMTGFPLQRCFRHSLSQGATDNFAEAFR
jgi:hypothetical protein